MQINVHDEDFKEAVKAQMQAASISERQARSLVIMQRIMQQTATAQGEYARASGSASTQMTRVRESMQQLVSTVANELNPVMASLLSNLNSGIQGVTTLAKTGLVTAGSFVTILGGAAASAVKMNDSFSKTIALMKGMEDLSNIDFFRSLNSKVVLDIKKTLGNMKLEAWGFGQVLQESFKKGEQSFGTWITAAQSTHEIEDQMKGVGRAFDALATKQDFFFKSGLGTLKAWGEDVTGLATKYKSVSTEADHMLESWVKIQQLQALYDQGLSNPEEIAKAVTEYQESLGALTKLRASFSEDFIGKVLKYDMQAGYELKTGLESLNQAFAQTGELSHKYLSLTNADFSDQGAMVPIFDDLQQRMRDLSVSILGCDRAMSDWLRMNPNDFFVAMNEHSLSLSESLQALEKRSNLAVHAFSQLLDPNVKQVDKLKYAFEALSKQTETLRKAGGMSAIGGITIDGPNGVKNVSQSLSDLTMKIIQSKAAQRSASIAQAKAAKTAYLWLNKEAKQNLLLNNELSRSQLLFASLEGATSMIENVNGAIGDTAQKSEMLGAVGDKLHESLMAAFTDLPNSLDLVNKKMTSLITTTTTFVGAIFSGGGRGSMLFMSLSGVMKLLEAQLKSLVKNIRQMASSVVSTMKGLANGMGRGFGTILADTLKQSGEKFKSAFASFFAGVTGTVVTSFKGLVAGLKLAFAPLVGLLKTMLLFVGKAVAIIVAVAAVIDFTWATLKTLYTGIVKFINWMFNLEIPTPEDMWSGPITTWVAEWIMGVKKVTAATETLDEAIAQVNLVRDLTKQFNRIRDEVLNAQLDFSLFDRTAGQKLVDEVTKNADSLTQAKLDMRDLADKAAKLREDTERMRVEMSSLDAKDKEAINALKDKIAANASELQAITDEGRQLAQSVSGYMEAITNAYKEVHDKHKQLMEDIDDLKLSTLSDSDKMDELNSRIKSGMESVSKALFDPDYLKILTENREGFTRSLNTAKADYDKQVKDFGVIKQLVAKAGRLLNTDDMNEIAEQLNRTQDFSSLGFDTASAKQALQLLNDTRKEMKDVYGESMDSIDEMNEGFAKHFELLRNKMGALTAGLADIDKQLNEIETSDNPELLAKQEKLLNERLNLENKMNDQIRTGNKAIIDFIKHIGELADEESKLTQNWIENMEASSVETWKMQHMAVEPATIDMEAYSKMLDGLKQEYDTKATTEQLIKIKEAQASYYDVMKKEIQYISKHIDKPKVTLETVNALQ